MVSYALQVRVLLHGEAGMSSAPFTYIDEHPSAVVFGKKYPMAFMGGLAAVVQHADLALEPVFGWAVVEKSE